MNKVKLTKEEIEKLASLSKIKLTKQEIEKFTIDMDTILSSVETLEHFEKETGTCVENSKFTEIPFSDLRQDEVIPSMPQKDVLANAPHQERGYFKVYGNTVDNDNS